MRRGFWIFLLPLLFQACATAPPAPPASPAAVPEALLLEDPFDASYKVRCDDASGKTVCVMTGNALRPFNPRYPMLSLGLVSEASPDGTSRYFLRAVYIDESRWLNICAKSPLVLTAGDISLEIHGPGSLSSRYVSEKGKLYEVAIYETSAEDIRRIAESKDVVVKLRGDFLLEKRFAIVNQLYFQQFVRHYIDKRPATAK